MPTLPELTAAIRPLDQSTMQQAAHYLDSLLKPYGSLGRLEVLAIRLTGISRTLHPAYSRKKIIVMAADHGVYAEGVAVTPREVTAIQAANMVQGLTGVCVLARSAGADIQVVDVGIDSDPIPGVLNCKVRRGCDNIAREAAMSRDEAETLLEVGAEIALTLVDQGTQLIGVGELGIANTTPAAAIVSVLCDVAPEDVVGLGANLPQQRLPDKIAVVERAIEINAPNPNDPLDVLSKVGGFDLAGMAGAMLGGAAAGVPVVLDGFLSYAAALLACAIEPRVRDYLIPSHLSAEKGAQLALQRLGLVPYLDLSMRLGEGSGAALAFPLIDGACAVLNEMGRLEDSNIVLPN